MFVILKHGGKQYWAQSGSVLALDKIDLDVGASVDLEIIATGSESNVECKNKSVKAVILKHYRDDKVIVFKKKRRHHYTRKRGHRQDITQVQLANFS